MPWLSPVDALINHRPGGRTVESTTCVQCSLAATATDQAEGFPAAMESDPSTVLTTPLPALLTDLASLGRAAQPRQPPFTVSTAPAKTAFLAKYFFKLTTRRMGLSFARTAITSMPLELDYGARGCLSQHFTLSRQISGIACNFHGIITAGYKG